MNSALEEKDNLIDDLKREKHELEQILNETKQS